MNINPNDFVIDNVFDHIDKKIKKFEKKQKKKEEKRIAKTMFGEIDMDKYEFGPIDFSEHECSIEKVLDESPTAFKVIPGTMIPVPEKIVVTL